MKLLCIFFIFPFLLAFKFNPMSQAIELGPGKKSAQFLAENETDEKMAIEFSAKERVMDAEGKETLPDAPALSVFPPQVIIPPKEKRTIRVNWNGPTPDKELAFRVIAEQLPLNVEGKKRASGIQMLMRYMAALYVTPKDVEAKLESSLKTSAPGTLTLVVKNSGKKHQILAKPTLVIRKDSKKWTLKEPELAGLAGENILAQSERVFVLKTKETFPVDAEVSLKVEE